MGECEAGKVTAEGLSERLLGFACRAVRSADALPKERVRPSVLGTLPQDSRPPRSPAKGVRP